MEKHFHLARTLTRVERRTQLAKMGRAWRTWGEVVRAEGEAELQRFERHFHVAQTVARVVARAHQRRLSRAWSLWARLAARGRPARRGVSASLSSLPLLGAAAARGSHGGASRLARVGVATSPGPGGIVAAPPSAAVDSATTEQLRLQQQQQQQQARRSVAVMYEAGAGAVRGLLRRAEARRLSCSWRAWRKATTADATRQARAILGATRIEELFVEAQKNHTARVLRRSWAKWAGWSTEEGGRLEREAEAASWAEAEAEADAAAADAAAAAAAAAAVQAAGVTEEGPATGAGGRANNLWSTGTVQHESTPPAGTPTTEGVKTPHGDGRVGENPGRVAASASPPGSAVSALRRRLRGETSLELPPAAATAETSRSPSDVIPPPGRLASATSPPLPRALAGGLETPASLLPPQRFAGARGDSTPPGSGQAWSDQLNYSSSPFSPSQPPAAAGVAMPSTSFSLNGRAHPEEAAAPFPADRPGEDLRSNSLDLTASGESFGAPQSRSAVGRALPTTTADATTVGVALASPEGSLAAYMSDSSPLLGESVLMFRGVGGGGGVGGGSEEAISSGGGGGGGGGRVLALFSGEDSNDERPTAETPPPASPARHGDKTTGANGGFAGVGNGSGVTRTTPARSPLLAGSGSGGGGGGGGRSGRRGRPRFPKSPPYVGGSVGLLSLSQGSPPWDVEEEEGRIGGGAERRHEFSPSYGHGHDGGDETRLEDALDDDAVGDGAEIFQPRDRSEQQHQEEPGSEVPIAPGFRAVDGHMTRAAEHFVDIMASIFWRWAFQRWARVARDAAFTQKANETRLKVCMSEEYKTPL